MPASRGGPKAKLIRDNVRTVKELYPEVTNSQMLVLREMTRSIHLSVRVGDLLMLNGRWYVTHSGLLRVAQRRRCSSIKTELVETVSNPSEGRWVFKATVLNSESQTFVGYGDADPSNVSFLVHGAEMRIAETRAVNRALRKAYGIGICSVEEIGSFKGQTEPTGESRKTPQPTNGNGNGGRTVRDHLCQIIRQHQLDPNLVKAYATGFHWHQGTPRCHAGASRSFCRAFGRLGRERPQRPELPAQQLSRPERRCSMKRQIAGLHAADRCAADQIPDGLFLVRVQRVWFRRQAQKPYYTLALAILEPGRFSGHVISSRLYCNPKALWKFNWFLRDFGYDVELLGRDEVDESQLIGLTGVVKISHIIINGASLLRLDGFAPAGRWEELSPANLDGSQVA